MLFRWKTLSAVFLLALGVLLLARPALAFEYPPSVSADRELQQQLETAFQQKGTDYRPRTHLMVDGAPKYLNRLIESVSPYLLQHAHNPVDWHPWSREVLDRAKRENRLIFLSIGYATCHWCHVMEKESFDQEDVARVLNENFISIKIDREEHPDLDHFFLTATQLQQGQAGWPNTLWLTPDARPFNTGTYFSRQDLIRTSLLLAEGWRSPSARADIVAVADGLAGQILEVTGQSSGRPVPLEEILYGRAVEALLEQHNDLEGGFSETNQFPQEAYLLFLLDQWRRGGPEAARDAVIVTLEAIAAGGIHDHVGGGFHRYAVDPGWRTPHFEKMLYNQALLARVFLEAWEIDRSPPHRRVVERTLDYVIREMTAKNGAFHSAEDADSANAGGQVEEGAYYVWRYDQLETAMQGSGLSATVLNGGSPVTGNDPIALHLDPLAGFDAKLLDSALARLAAVRSLRAKPFQDIKQISGWNGLMIRALAAAGSAFGNERYLDAAKQAADTVWERMWQRGKLVRFLANGESKGEGLLEDYAWLGLGFVALADAGAGQVWLERAQLLAETALQNFSDNRGRLKQASRDGPLGPVFSAVDDATPSAESSMLELLGLLVHRTDKLEYFAHADKLATALSPLVAQRPGSLVYALLANRLLYEGDSTVRQIRAKGNVAIHLNGDKLVLNIREGWHLSANVPGYDYLIGTRIDGAKAQWPKGRRTKLGFASQEAFVYEGRLEIPLQIEAEELVLTVQACSDRVCLAPEEARFRVVTP